MPLLNLTVFLSCFDQYSGDTASSSSMYFPVKHEMKGIPGGLSSNCLMYSENSDMIGLNASEWKACDVFSLINVNPFFSKSFSTLAILPSLTDTVQVTGEFSAAISKSFPLYFSRFSLAHLTASISPSGIACISCPLLITIFRAVFISNTPARHAAVYSPIL